MRRATALGLVLAVVLVALTVAAPALGPAEERIRIEPGELEDDRPLGEVAGYTAEDSLDIEEGELSRADLEALKYRSMARVEEIRGLRFEEDVAFEVISREQYRGETTRGEGEAGPFVNEVWRGAFVVDGETEVNEAMGELYGDAVLGYYSNDRIVLVVSDIDSFRVDRSTLVHELVHALQDQHFGLDRYGETLDEQRAETGLIEGEANYVPALYDERCGAEWECLDEVERGQAQLRERPFNVGLFASIYAPYAAGPPFVAHLHENEGWEAVDRAFEERPASTSQLIHPERYPDVAPENVSVEDRSGDDWEPFTEDDGNASADVRTETVGEATLFATLFANGVVSRPIDEGVGDLGRYNYSYPTTDGWAGDTLVAYHDADDENRTGHVWELAWESEGDADEFADAYRKLLAERGAERIDDTGNETYQIPENRSFAGAYRLSVEGDRVTIVGGPTADSIEEIRPEGTERTAARSTPIGAPEAGPESIPSPPAAPAVETG